MMNRISRGTGVTATLTLAAGLAISGIAQAQPTYKNYCQSAGPAVAMEPIGDRAGHAISAGSYSCRTEGGPMDGAVVIGSNYFEWDGPSAIARGSIGISRKAGSSLIYAITEQKNTLIMVDGKVTGVSGSGRGTYTLGTGAAAALTGKGFTFVFKNTGFNQFVTEATHD